MRRIWSHEREEDYNEAGGVLVELFSEYEFDATERLTFLCSAVSSVFYELMNVQVADADICMLFDDCMKAMHAKLQDDLETRYEFNNVVRQYESSN